MTLLEARERPGGTQLDRAQGHEDRVCGWDDANDRLGRRATTRTWDRRAAAEHAHDDAGLLSRVGGWRWRWRSIRRGRALLENDRADGGKVVAQRKVINDTRGRISELLSKCLAQGALDQELSREDRERMTVFLKEYGPLDKTGAYVGSDRAGVKVAAGAGTQVEVNEVPLDMHTLLDANFWNAILYEEVLDWQGDDDAAGGRDGPDSVCVCAGGWGRWCSTARPVTEIRKTAHGVRIG